MDDLRGKVIYSIGRCICHVPDACRDCAYDAGHPYNECVELLLKDALSLLKAQEPQTVIVDDIPKDDTWFGIWFGRCPNCKEMLTKKYHKHFCGNCGQAVKWYD